MNFVSSRSRKWFGRLLAFFGVLVLAAGCVYSPGCAPPPPPRYYRGW